MNDLFACDEKDALIGYLYDEIEPSDRKRVADHLRGCATCRAELDALGGVRSELAAWRAPDVELGLTMVRKGAVPAARSWWDDVPVWARAVAAVLVLAVGAAILNLQIRSGADGVVVTTGWMSPAAGVSGATGGREEWQPALAALESRLRGEIRSARPESLQPVATAGKGIDSDVVRQVQALLAASEQRQRQELALRITQLTRDVNVQRNADLMRIEQGFGQFEGRTGNELARQRQMINYVMRVSGQPQQ